MCPSQLNGGRGALLPCIQQGCPHPRFREDALPVSMSLKYSLKYSYPIIIKSTIKLSGNVIFKYRHSYITQQQQFSPLIIIINIPSRILINRYPANVHLFDGEIVNFRFSPLENFRLSFLWKITKRKHGTTRELAKQQAF